jgi:hypothetical protein
MPMSSSWSWASNIEAWGSTACSGKSPMPLWLTGHPQVNIFRSVLLALAPIHETAESYQRQG